MKLTTRDIIGFFSAPPDTAPAVLIYGPDPMRVALKREQFIKNLLGPNADTEMRLTRFSASELRKEPARLQDATKAQGFFPGKRAVFIEDATETVAKIILDGLSSWDMGDATIVVTAGQLKPTSSLRKGFESHKSAVAAAIYDNPPTRAEIESELKTAGLINIPQDALSFLTELARDLEPGDFRQTVQKIALYKFHDASPLTTDEVLICAPTSNEADIDDLLTIVAAGQPERIGPVMARLQSQGVQPVTLLIGASRHFRTLYSVASHPRGISEGLSKLRPPVFGPRRDQIQRQSGQWGAPRLQQAITLLTDLDLQLRSAGQTAPSLPLVERALIRLAHMAR